MEARFYRSLADKKVQCLLCPHQCTIPAGHSGICHVRHNVDGILVATSYATMSSLAIDPIEKKPLYHFHPGKRILSIGNVGCNFHCRCCQNYSIAQTGTEGYSLLSEVKIDELLQRVDEIPNNIGLAFTYNEPIVGFEFVYDVASQLQERGCKVVLVSNGYISAEPLKTLLPIIDAFNIDVKTYNEDCYRDYFGGRLKTVLSTIDSILKSGKHVELTYLAIPGVNDNLTDFERFIRQLSELFGRDIVFHLSRYFPRYKETSAPTPEPVLYAMADIAASHLTFLYLGNLLADKYTNTYCPFCSNLLINRNGYTVHNIGVSDNGCCLKCHRSLLKYILV